MSSSRVYHCCLGVLLLAAAVAPLRAQAPVLTAITPNGMQRGTTLDVVLTGNNLAGPTQIWTDFPAQVRIPTDAGNGKDNGRLRVRVKVAHDAPVGFGAVRLATTRGVSNFRLFCIDDLPQILQTDKSRARETAAPLPVPCVVVGRTKPETRDWYSIKVAAGQRLSFDVLGRRLGAPLDPQITIMEAKTGREIAHCDDAAGLKGDARLTCTFQTAGDYLVELHDTLWRGGENYTYRLRVGDFPCATTSFPMAIRRGKKTVVHFAGSAAADAQPVEVQAPSDPAVNALWVTPRGPNGLAGWPVVVGISDLDERLEKEPNDAPAQANPLSIPGAVTGTFLHRGDVDHYRIHGKKGQALYLRVWTHEYGSPAEIEMRIFSPQGAAIAEVNPQAPPPGDRQLDFTPPADGDYVIAVSELSQDHGADQTYRLTVEPATPDFSLVLAATRFAVPQRGDTTIPVQVVRRGYNGPITLRLIASRDIHGTGAIAAGQPAGTLEPKAPANILLGAYPIAIEGQATINGHPVTRFASVTAAVSKNLDNLPFPPLPLVREIVLGVTPKAPFILAAHLERPEAYRGGSATVTVTAQRDAGFSEPITLSAAGLPPNVSAALPAIAKGQSQAVGKLNIAANAPLGSFSFIVAGATKHQGLDLSAHTDRLPLVLTLPIEVKAEPASLSLKPGGKAVLQIHALRKGGYTGAISLEVRNLPAGVTASKIDVPTGKDKGEIVIQAAPKIAPARKADVQVVGTATAAGNQQAVSANLVVNVANPPKRK